MIAIGQGLFHAHVGFTWLLLPFLVIGPALFVSLGLLAGSTAKDPESAAVVGNLITFPMMFLAGTFFPVSEFPSWLAAVAHVLPLYYVIDGMNNALLYGNVAASLEDLLVVTVLTAIFFAAAIRAFRWREK
jgi:ABC-2 type transport system permease protein